ncbi:MAG: hypothetical protein PHI66_02115 [Candidatus Pacebacteria bacterium]|nr:hypothetical protein [Candidatus Paceibacterota bacterium]
MAKNMPGVKGIALEPLLDDNGNPKDPKKIWVFNTDLLRIDRGDGKISAAVVAPHPAGYFGLKLVESPGMVEDGTVPIVDGVPISGGRIFIAIFNGVMIVQENIGWNGSFLESAYMGSLERLKQEHKEYLELGLEQEAEHVGFVQTNAQRIEGMVEVLFVRLKGLPPLKDGQQYMSIEYFASLSDDGRCLASLLKATGVIL